MYKTKLTVRELREYRLRLQGLVARLGGEVSELRDEVLRPVGAEAADGPSEEWVPVQQSDLAARAAGEELALDLLAPESHVLSEATAALGRIEQGTFGRCEGCGRRIARARLDALPYARTCVRCAREAPEGGAG